jgi:cell division septum initiation protein DivIVA
MTDRPYEDYEDQQFERSELFALGAAAGAVITAAIASYLERRRRPRTAWEKAQAQGAEALEALSSTTQASVQQARQAAARVGERLQGRGATTTSRWWRPTRKRATKQRKQDQKWLDLTDIVATVLGVATAGSVLEKAREYATSATGRMTGDTLRDVVRSAQDYASVAQRPLRDVHLGDKAKYYGGAVAGYTTGATRATRQAAQKSATRLTKGASHLAEATTEQAQELRKGVRKTAKRTRRRASWGLRAFIIGLVVGLLAAPQSGRRTRDLLTSFVQDMLDVFMPDEQSSARP